MNNIQISDINASALRLFKSVLISKKIKKQSDLKNEDIIFNGVILSPEVLSFGGDVSDLKKEIVKLYGYNIKELNNAFHKSFSVVKNSPIEKLRIQQLCHYITTYGAEAMGFYDKDLVYIPAEVLSIPENTVPLKLTVIHGLEKDELIEKVLKLVNSGIALSKQSVLDASLIITNEFDDVSKLDIDNIKNKEVKIALYDFYKITPSNPVEFLRYLIFKTTGSTLMIKNRNMINSIKSSDRSISNKLFTLYLKDNSITALASVFYRHKDLWLAFKTSETASIINTMRRLADKYHKPCKVGILDTVTSCDTIDLDLLKKELTKVTVFKKVSLANAILYRLNSPKSIAYRIRNGRVFAKEFSAVKDPSILVYDVILESILEDIRPKVAGKTFFLPENISYVFPVSEKNFVGNVPSGSYIDMGKRAAIGVHWTNILDQESKEEFRVDLDFWMQNDDLNIGWDEDQRCNDDIFFTGDMTDAPLPTGASEVGYIGESIKNQAILFTLNYYNYDCDSDNKNINSAVDYTLVLDSPDNSRIDKFHLLDSKTILATFKNKISTESNIGVLVADEEGNKRFIFSNVDTGINRIASFTEHKKQLLDSLIVSSDSQLKLIDVLELAGAKVVHDPSALSNDNDTVAVPLDFAILF